MKCNNRSQIVAISLAIMAVTLALPSARATTRTVTSTADSGAGTLREALASAADGDTIDATGVAGTITLTTGELLVTNSVNILGPGSANLAVDGHLPTTTNSVFYIAPSNTVAISSLTITNGARGISNDHSTLTVSNCTVTGNSAFFGGGGGIYNGGRSGGSAKLTVSASTVSGNSAHVGAGGGIFNDGGFGGNATLTVSASTVTGNSAVLGSGGGIYNDGESSGSATLTIANSTLSGNSSSGLASGGGGIVNGGFGGTAMLVIANSTLSGNSAPSGGGIFNSGFGGSATLTIVNSTISGNSCGPNGNGGGIFNINGGTLEIGNTILKTGVAGENIFNDGGLVTSHGYNLSSDVGGFWLTGMADQISTNPLLDPAGLQDNGGPTLTIALLCGSPALDNGKRDTIAELASDADQRGLPRPVDDPAIADAAGGDGSDIGAFETQPSACVTPTGVHDFAVIKLKAPRKIPLSAARPNKFGKFSVTIQNRSAHADTIPDLATIRNLVTIVAESLGACPDVTPALVAPRATFPIPLASKKKLTLAFLATFTTNCVNDALPTTKLTAHNDYQINATIHTQVIDVSLDTFPGDDTCPRSPLNNVPLGTGTITDKGCGGKDPVSKQLGAPVFTDVIVK